MAPRAPLKSRAQPRAVASAVPVRGNHHAGRGPALWRRLMAPPDRLVCFDATPSCKSKDFRIASRPASRSEIRWRRVFVSRWPDDGPVEPARHDNVLHLTLALCNFERAPHAGLRPAPGARGAERRRREASGAGRRGFDSLLGGLSSCAHRGATGRPPPSMRRQPIERIDD